MWNSKPKKISSSSSTKAENIIFFKIYHQILNLKIKIKDSECYLKNNSIILTEKIHQGSRNTYKALFKLIFLQFYKE